MRGGERDGVRLACDDTRGGGAAAVLIHGLGGDRTFLAPQAEHLRGRFRVVSVDLRGHGASDAPPGDYSVATLAEDVAHVCRALGLARPLLVGHSLGGVLAVEIAARRLHPVAGVIVLDAPLLPPDGFFEAQRPFLDGLRAPGYAELVRAFFAGTFAPADDPARKARVLDTMARTPQHVLAAAASALTPWDGAAALARLDVPLLLVGSFAPNDLTRLRAIRPDAFVGQTVGTGHFHQLEVPEQIHPMIDRFLAVTGLG